MIKKIFFIVSRIVIAVILVQTLYYKFGAHPDSVYIFTRVGLEPWGRYLTGIIELMASVFLIFTRTAWLGALLSAGTMSGAIFFHLTSLGVEVSNDGGQLFAMAVIVWICSLLVMVQERDKIVRLFKSGVGSGK